MSTILLIDASPLIYANFAQVGHFSTKAGEPTGVRYGVTRSIRSYADKVRADKVCVVFDKPGAVLKAAGVESYKSDRVVTDEKRSMWDQIPALRELLSLTRWAQADADGFEADDIIGHLARLYSAAGHTIYIVSPDNDLVQLVSPLVKVWMPPKGKGKAWFKDNQYCLDHFGVYPHALLHYRAVVGDKSDNVSGLGSGKDFEKTWQALCNSLEDGRKTSPDQFVAQFPELPDEAKYRQNYNLMSLHDPGDAMVIQKGLKDAAALSALFERLEMKSMLNFVDDLTRS